MVPCASNFIRWRLIISAFCACVWIAATVNSQRLMRDIRTTGSSRANAKTSILIGDAENKKANERNGNVGRVANASMIGLSENESSRIILSSVIQEENFSIARPDLHFEATRNSSKEIMRDDQPKSYMRINLDANGVRRHTSESTLSTQNSSGHHNTHPALELKEGKYQNLLKHSNSQSVSATNTEDMSLDAPESTLYEVPAVLTQRIGKKEPQTAVQVVSPDGTIMEESGFQQAIESRSRLLTAKPIAQIMPNGEVQTLPRSAFNKLLLTNRRQMDHHHRHASHASQIRMESSQTQDGFIEELSPQAPLMTAPGVVPTMPPTAMPAGTQPMPAASAGAPAPVGVTAAPDSAGSTWLPTLGGLTFFLLAFATVGVGSYWLGQRRSARLTQRSEQYFHPRRSFNPSTLERPRYSSRDGATSPRLMSHSGSDNPALYRSLEDEKESSGAESPLLFQSHGSFDSPRMRTATDPISPRRPANLPRRSTAGSVMLAVPPLPRPGTSRSTYRSRRNSPCPAQLCAPGIATDEAGDLAKEIGEQQEH